MPRFATEVSYISRSMARVRADIAYADVASLSSSVAVRDRCAVVRSYIYVWLAGMLERVVTDVLVSAVAELGSQAIPMKDIRLSLFSLLADAKFSSLRDSRSVSWDVRATMFKMVTDTAPSSFVPDVLPLDGRTIRAEHFDTLWCVFELPGPSLPSHHHRSALRELADGRNNVAHGTIDPVTFGKLRTTLDVERLALRIEDAATHLLASLDDYLARRLFVR